ncbi:replication protein A 70 kDa DNA-binding subunit B [Tanacetum coccineum]
MGYQETPSLSSNNYKKNIGVGGSAMGYQKTPTLSSNNYKKNVGVGARSVEGVRLIDAEGPLGSTFIMRPDNAFVVQQRDGYDANQMKIEFCSPEVKVVSIAEFFHGAINRMVGDIRDSKPEHGWAYTACKQCNKKVDILPRQNRPPVYVCEEHGTVQPASRFKVIVRVIDESGSTPLLFFNNNFVKLSGHTT